MTPRHIFHILFYAAIAALFAAFVVQFFVGELGIVESGNKQHIIAELKADIAAIEGAAGEKLAEIERLLSDRRLIRSHALLYGMVGGLEYGPAPASAISNSGAEGGPSPDSENEGTPSRTKPSEINSSEGREQAAPPFLLRHPILIVLPSAIALLCAGFAMKQRSDKRKKANTKFQLSLGR